MKLDYRAVKSSLILMIYIQCSNSVAGCSLKLNFQMRPSRLMLATSMAVLFLLPAL